MWHHMNNGWGMGLGWIFMVLVLGLIIVGIVALVKWLITQTSVGQRPPVRHLQLP